LQTEDSKAQERSKKEVLKEILFPVCSYNSLALPLTGLLNLTLAIKKKKEAEGPLLSCLLTISPLMKRPKRKKTKK